MDKSNNYAVGIDVGTENVRAVVLAASDTGEYSVVGFNEGKTSGMRKGVPANLAGPASSIDNMLSEVEHMCGQDVNTAYISTNGSQISSIHTEGMISAGAAGHEIDGNDLDRIEEVAVRGSVPANRTILDIVPLEYSIDGQRGIKDPIGMSGTRLEMRACVVTALSPNIENLKKLSDVAKVFPAKIVPSAVAAARAVLTEKQRENGVAVVDFGAATTSIAIFEEGDLQYVGVVPAGSNNITNDLAIMLAIEPALAEEIKERFITGDFNSEKSAVIRVGKDEHAFERKEVEQVAHDRLLDIFTEVRKKIKFAKYDQRLPEGIVLTGAGAKMRDIDIFVREVMEASVKVGVPYGLNGMANDVAKPEYAVAVGLALLCADDSACEKNILGKKKNVKNTKKDSKSAFDFVKKFFAKF